MKRPLPTPAAPHLRLGDGETYAEVVTDDDLDEINRASPLPEGLQIRYGRFDLNTYDAISVPLAQTRIAEAKARSEEARQTFAVPEEERTKQLQEKTEQLKTLLWPMTAIAALSVVAIAINPDAGKWIAAVAAALFALFGGVTLLGRRKPQLPPPPGPSADASEKSEAEEPR